MEENFDTWKKSILIAIIALVCAAVAGALYVWYELSSVGNGPAGVSSTQTATTSVVTLQESAQALREAAAQLQESTSTGASPAAPANLQASQQALEQAVAQSKQK